MDFAHKRPKAVFFKIFILTFLYLLWGCAEIAPPPGGDVDKTKPRIIGTFPENGSVNVPISDEIRINFSERIVKPTAGKAVYISPRPSKEPEIKWKSNNIIIKLADSMEANQTYIISFGDGIKDLRNNPIDTGSTIAFSTGPKIASGRISGYVEDIHDQPQKSMLVGLFDRDILTQNIPIDSVYPKYISVSDKDGFFAFQYIPEGHYLLFAFKDRNRNERFDPQIESFALPDREIIIDSLGMLKDILLTLNNTDTSSARISSISYSVNGVLNVKLTKNIELSYLEQHPENLVVKNLDTDSSFKGHFLIESEAAEENIINGFLGDIPEGLYSCRVLFDSTRPPIVDDSLQIKYVEDKTAPKIIYFIPNQYPQFLEDLDISLQFSEPIDTSKLTDNSFILIDSDSGVVPISKTVLNPSKISFNSEALQGGQSYSFIIADNEISDLSGNVLGDSIQSYTINIISPDSTGEVSGTVDIEMESLQEIPVFLRFWHLGTGQTYDIEVVDKTFSTILPSGRYRVSGYIDVNRDNKRSLGSLFPFELSEPYTVDPDTVAVRARFETSDIKIIFK